METILNLTERYPLLESCREQIVQASELLITAFERGQALYVCGNGGSAADADHIVGELMKGFLKKRPLSQDEKMRFAQTFGQDGEALAHGLMGALPAVSLHSQGALMTAFMNDEDPSLVFAQTLYGLGKEGDVLLAISTSGNSLNVLQTARVANMLGMKVITLTGERECLLDPLSDVAIHVGERETYRVQELHLPVYHWLCATVEAHFYKE